MSWGPVRVPWRGSGDGWVDEFRDHRVSLGDLSRVVDVDHDDRAGEDLFRRVAPLVLLVETRPHHVEEGLVAHAECFLADFEAVEHRVCDLTTDLELLFHQARVHLEHFPERRFLVPEFLAQQVLPLSRVERCELVAYSPVPARYGNFCRFPCALVGRAQELREAHRLQMGRADASDAITPFMR